AGSSAMRSPVPGSSTSTVPSAGSPCSHGAVVPGRSSRNRRVASVSTPRGSNVVLIGSPAQVDVLGLEELGQAVPAPFPPDPALLDSAEGRRRVGEDARVDAHHPHLEGLGGA